ncbi:MAG: GTP-binding protein [SAR324 cluster bacterium]|nr:GTP-binding protein [SAR324 cluster bacterium]
MAEHGSLIPVNVVTGFLGSGKTTLLSRLLRSPRLRDTAVLVNELGEVGLDHHLLEQVDEQTVLMQNGCLCCSIRGDLQQGLGSLLSRSGRGEVPAFKRVVVETSGLADPAPIAYTVLTEPVLRHHFRMGSIVTTVDGVNGISTLERFSESVKQAAMADRLVLTKSDLADAGEFAALGRRLTALNPSAPQFDAAGGEIDPVRMLVEDPFDPQGRAREVRGWFENAGELSSPQGDRRDFQNHDFQNHGFHNHGEIRSLTLTFDEPLDWTAFGVWLTMLLHCHGEDVLRVKGLLNVAGEDTPVIVNGVQHMVHPPAHLEAWPDADRRSRIVFVIRGNFQQALQDSLAAFNRLANPGG